MPDSAQTSPTAPNEDAKRRQEDVERATSLGQKIAGKEKKRKETMREAEKAQTQQSKDAMMEGIATQEEAEQKAKGFRAMKKEREAEIELDLARRKAEADKIRKINDEREAKRAKERQYMKDLREQAEVKLQKELRERVVKDEERKIRANDMERMRSEMQEKKKQQQQRDRISREKKEQKELLRKEEEQKKKVEAKQKTTIPAQKAEKEQQAQYFSDLQNQVTRNKNKDDETSAVKAASVKRVEEEKEAKKQKEEATRKAELGRKRAEQKVKLEKKKVVAQPKQKSPTEKEKETDRIVAKSAEAAGLRSRADADHLAAIQDAERTKKQDAEKLEHDIRARTGVLETQYKQDLYTLERTYRSRVAVLDSEESNKKSQMRTANASEAQSMHRTIEMEMKPRRKKIDDEFSEAKMQKATELQSKKLILEAEKKDALSAIAAAYRSSIARSEQLLSKGLSDAKGMESK